MTEPTTPQQAPYTHSGRRVPLHMLWVLLACLPVALTQTSLWGLGSLMQIGFASLGALAGEALALRLRKRPVRATLLDLSALLTGVLLGLCLPPALPPGVAFLGGAFASLVGKQLFGGLGHNPFNPAMLAWVFLLVNFPLAMTQWPDASTVDALTSATPLDTLRHALQNGQMISEAQVTAPQMHGLFGARDWEWINFASLLGGLFLLFTRVIHWRIPVMVILGLCTPALILHVWNPDAWASPLWQLLSGSSLFAAFFIATDPVTACTGARARLVYGFGIGFLAWGIRVWGDYPDGFAFAVLLMNAAAPLLDHVLRPQPYGAGVPPPGAA